MDRRFPDHMIKWLIAIGGTVLIGWFIWFQLNATKISYVNGLAPYDVMPGREYILQHDACVFAWRENPTAGFPLLGVNHPDVRTSIAALPFNPARNHIDQGGTTARVMDVIPRGTRLLLTSVRREQSRRTGTLITYEAKFLDGVERPYQKVDLRPLLIAGPTPEAVPEVDATALVPWVKR